MVICLKRHADLYMVQLMLLPLTVSCFSKIQVGFTFLVPAHLGSPGKRPLNGCCCCCICHFICEYTLQVSVTKAASLSPVSFLWHLCHKKVYLLCNVDKERSSWASACVCIYVHVCIAASVPVQPDWLFNRPSLTMDFVTDTAQCHDPVSWWCALLYQFHSYSTIISLIIVRG